MVKYHFVLQYTCLVSGLFNSNHWVQLCFCPLDWRTPYYHMCLPERRSYHDGVTAQPALSYTKLNKLFGFFSVKHVFQSFSQPHDSSLNVNLSTGCSVSVVFWPEANTEVGQPSTPSWYPPGLVIHPSTKVIKVCCCSPDSGQRLTADADVNGCQATWAGELKVTRYNVSYVTSSCMLTRQSWRAARLAKTFGLYFYISEHHINHFGHSFALGIPV